jgi:hypothetical protein
VGPPISRGGPAFHADSWRLFDHYLAYVIKETPHPYWNICSAHLHNACEAGANSLDAWSIGLSVAVEGLAALIPMTLDDEQKKNLETLRDFINAQVAADATHKAYADRVRGMVNGLTAIRAIDRLRMLAAQGGTVTAHVKAWQELRNKQVHPSVGPSDNPASRDFQEQLDLVHQDENRSMSAMPRKRRVAVKASSVAMGQERP